MAYHARITVACFTGLLLCAASALAWVPPDYEAVGTVTHTIVAVATSSTSAIAAKSNRILLILENTSDTNIDCKIGATAVAGEGIRIYAGGGALYFDKKYPTQAINCIHASTGTKTLTVTEGVQ